MPAEQSRWLWLDARKAASYSFRRMSFASLTFVLFCTVVFGLHYAKGSQRWQNGVMVLASYVFYSWWDWRFCSLMLVSSLVDYWAGRAICRTGSPVRRKLYLAASLGTNLGMLGFFKYSHFFVDNLTALMASIGLPFHTGTLHIILPVGISFYTFQTMSYTIDIYRGHFRPVRDFGAYMAFVSFFPQLVAGPIERASHLLPQFLTVRRFDAGRAWLGMRLILWGLFKKMVLADNLAAAVDEVYRLPGAWPGAVLALATLAFAFQIYCDFSAYSDIASGTAHLFGIELMRNFAFPYFSRSPTEFWRRWHISLSTWFRDYVYIPLGGSRGTPGRTRFNILATFALSGFWHGASWNFVVWGLLNGVGMLAWRGRASAKSGAARAGDFGERFGWGGLLGMAGTFLFICLTWVFFRAATMGDAWSMVTAILSMKGGAEGWAAAGVYLGAHRLVFQLLPLFLLAEWLRRRTWHVLALRDFMESWMALVFVVAAFLVAKGSWGGYGLILPGWACGWVIRQVAPPMVLAGLGRACRWLFFSALFWLILYAGTYVRGAFIYFQF
jgi:alginate O-acetyltransferase complex protein AlgI